MNALEMRALVNDCCAAFNASPPPARSCELWAEMCDRVPVRAAAFIRARILERETLPRNFGKAVLDLHREWQSTLPAPERRACCPDCDPALPGFFYAWKRDASGILHSLVFRCLCNEDPALGDMPRASKEKARREGYAVMPRGWKGGPAGFEMREFSRRGAVPPPARPSEE